MDKKIVLVTGASSGIGKATAMALLKKGYIVYAAARNVEQMADIEKQGAKVIRMDVARAVECDACMERILSENGRIDVLVNNAGFGVYGSIEEVDLDDARYQFEVNVFGMAGMIRRALPYMRQRGEGMIINISSIAGKMGEPLGGWYHASKHAVEALSDSLRMETEKTGIRVVIIEPGLIRTNFWKVAEGYLLRASGKGFYRKNAESLVSTFHRIDSSDGDMAGSSPDVIANVICKAVESANPKTRYVAGKKARITLWGKKILPARVFDRVISRVMMTDI